MHLKLALSAYCTHIFLYFKLAYFQTEGSGTPVSPPLTMPMGTAWVWNSLPNNMRNPAAVGPDQVRRSLKTHKQAVFWDTVYK